MSIISTKAQNIAAWKPLILQEPFIANLGAAGANIPFQGSAGGGASIAPTTGSFGHLGNLAMIAQTTATSAARVQCGASANQSGIFFPYIDYFLMRWDFSISTGVGTEASRNLYFGTFSSATNNGARTGWQVKISQSDPNGYITLYNINGANTNVTVLSLARPTYFIDNAYHQLIVEIIPDVTNSLVTFAIYLSDANSDALNTLGIITLSTAAAYMTVGTELGFGMEITNTTLAHSHTLTMDDFYIQFGQ